MSLPMDQLEHSEITEDDKYSKSVASKWRLVHGVLVFAKRLLRGVKSHNFKRLERNSLQVNKKILNEVKENLGLIEELGGLECIANALDTDLKNGLTRNTAQGVAIQRNKYGSNVSKNPRKSLFYFTRKALLDHNIVIMTVCGMVSIGVGVPAKRSIEGAKDGGSVLVAVLIAVFFMVATQRWSNKLLASLHDVVDTVEIDVVRAGLRQQVPVSDIVVGDVVLLKPGDRVPGHGLVIEQHFLKLETPADSINQQFLLSGAVVVDGFGSMLVTTVGVDECRRSSREYGNLKRQLKALESITSIIWYLFVIVFIPFVFLDKWAFTDENGTSLHGIAKVNVIVEVLVESIQIIFEIPNAWELSLMLTKAYATKQLKAGNNAQVFNHNALETMSYATVICTDKTGVVATDRIKVAKFWQPFQGFVGEESIDSKVKELLRKGIALNTSGCIYQPGSVTEFEVLGSSTEKAILLWAVEDLKSNLERIKTSHNIIDIQDLDSYSSIIADEKASNAKHVHLKGSPEIVLRMCSSYYDSSGTTKSLDDDQMRPRFEEIIRDMEESGHTCVAFAHRRVRAEEIEMEKLERLRENLILIGVVGISNPCREGVKSAARDCRTAGVKLKLITEDSIFTAKAIARECGILGEEEEVIQGTDFRNFSEEERMEKVDGISVMARASPSDKLLMAQCLKRKGHVVAIAGEFPSTEDADIAISMGTRRGVRADILILDREFSSVIQVLKWGRFFYRNVQRFVQFQLTAKIVLIVVYFIGYFLLNDDPLTTIHLVWLSLVTDTLGALAFSTLKPTNEVLETPPVRKNRIIYDPPLVTNVVLRNVSLQSVYQIAILLYFFRGRRFIFNLFVLFRVCVGLSSRELEAKSVFRRIHRNRLFLAIFGFSVALQVVLVEFELADTERLSWSEWFLCTRIALFTLPIGWLITLLPVPEKQVVGYVTELVRIKSSIKRLILRKLMYLSTWAAIVLTGSRNREQPRRGFCV